MSKLRVFLDTSALFTAVLSPGGGARAILIQSEFDLVSVFVGRRVLKEADEVLQRKAPEQRPVLAMLLEAANVQVGPEPDDTSLGRASEMISYGPDAYVMAEALSAQADYLVTHDQLHFLRNANLEASPCRVCSPGEFLALLRKQLSSPTP